MSCQNCKKKFENLPVYLAHIRECLIKTPSKIETTEKNVHINQILSNLYLGDFEAAGSRSVLNERKITHIINVAREINCLFPEDYKYMHIQLNDFYGQNISKYFDSVIQFIEDAINDNGTVLIHCAKGISRSGAFAILYVMYKKKMSYRKAHEHVSSCRPMIDLNKEFVTQLKEWEKTNIN